MTKIFLSTCHPPVADRLAHELRGAGFEVETLHADRSEAYGITYGAGVPREQIQRLLRVLAPLSPTHELGLVDGADVAIHIGLPARFEHFRVRLRVDGQEIEREAARALAALGLGPVLTETTVLPRSRSRASSTRHAGFARDLIEWWTSSLPIARPAREVDADGDRDELILDLVASRLASAPLEKRSPVIVCCDDEAVAKEMLVALRAEGFAPKLGDAEVARRASRLVCDVGVFARERERAGALRQCVDKLVRRVDRTKYPLVHRARTHGSATIVLPLGLAQAGALRPYGGDDAARFDVWIRTDDPSSVDRLRTQLEAGGFASLHVQQLAAPVGSWALDLGELDRESTAGRLLRGLVDDACFACELRGGASELEARRKARVFELSTRWREVEDDVDRGAIITIDAPTVTARKAWRHELDERRRLELAGACVFLRHEEGAAPARIAAAKERLLALGIKQVHTMLNLLEVAEITFASSSYLAAAALRDLAQPAWDQPLIAERRLPDDPTQLTVSMRLGVPTARERRRVGAHDVKSYDERPFVEVSAESVRIGTAILPRRVGEPGETTAKTERPPLCIDDETAATLDHVARAVILREPCLLEGETGTSKTSSIVWLAEQLRVPLARLNLHGQTDSGELVGRHLPARDGGWRWQEGLLLQAMRQGSWVLLDELNLAETDVLERIDSLLERAPSLVVSEHDLERFGDGGTPIHRDFRLFATMNPVGYAGRNRLSPAFLDRFRARRYVAGPDEHAYESLLRALVLGQQPSVIVEGRRWNEGELLAPPWARLAAFGQIEELLELLARLHASVVAAAANGDRGDVPKPTRRALLSVLDYLDQWHSAPPLSAEVVVEAVRRTYLAPLPPGPHRDAVAALLDAAGFEQLLRSFERTVATGEARLAEADADACHAEDSNEEAEATP